jgi:FkbM family methyltransferase
MKSFIKSIATAVADWVLRLRGISLPHYFHPSHRRHLVLFGIEPDITRYLKRHVLPGMTVLDIGANVGMITRLLDRLVGQSGHVFGFEPDPYTRGFLEHNVRNCPSVKVYSYALSDTSGHAEFHIHPQSGTSNSLIPIQDARSVFTVECLTVDEFLRMNADIKPDFIKIDVEGAEPRVFAGMTDTVAGSPGLRFISEFCPSNLAAGGYTPDDYFTSLVHLGVAVEVLGADGTCTPVRSLPDLLSSLGSECYCNLLCTSLGIPRSDSLAGGHQLT